MHSAQCTLPRIEGNVALDKLWIKAVRRKLPLTPGSSKEAALVTVRLDADLKDARQIGREKQHLLVGQRRSGAEEMAGAFRKSAPSV